MDTCLNVCMSTHMHLHVYVSVYVYVYACMHACTLVLPLLATVHCNSTGMCHWNCYSGPGGNDLHA